MSEILRFNFIFQEKSRNIQVAAEKNTGKLVCRCFGFLGEEDRIPDFNWETTMDEGDWEKLEMAIEDANARKWESSYINKSVEDAAEWSLEIHVLGKHTITEGYNRFPPEFDQFKQDLISFLRMKRRQLRPGVLDLRYISVAENKGLTSPIVILDKMEKTFTFYNLFDTFDYDGSYFFDDGDWDRMQDILRRYKVFDSFLQLPERSNPRIDSQCSVSLGYKQGQITQRYTGYEPDWWEGFATEVFNYITMIFTEGRKSADTNIGPMKQ